MSGNVLAPTSLDEVTHMMRDKGGELRAGGTEVTARQLSGRAAGPFVDLQLVPVMPSGIEWSADGSARIGALTTIAELAADPQLRSSYPALTMTAGALATSQIREAGTLGGNLLQRNRCWYYRNSHFSCFQTGGDGCPAREALNLYSVVVDQRPCVAPHPSSIAMTLLAYDAQAEVHDRGRVAVGELYGDGADPTRDHLLGLGEVLLAIRLPVPVAGERAAYHRAISRHEAEWPLVEAVARIVLDGPTISMAAVAVGGVAHTPLRLTEVEAALTEMRIGEHSDWSADLSAAASTALTRCQPLSQTGYKVELLRDTVLEVLERATAASA